MSRYDFKHVAYNIKQDRIYIFKDPHHCVDTKADWYDCQYQIEKKLLTNCRRIRAKKVETDNFVYIGKL